MFNDDGCAEDANVKKQQQQSLIKVSSTRRNKYIELYRIYLALFESPEVPAKNSTFTT